MSAPWPAPLATSPVDATVEVPGSKSITARALYLAAVADSPSVIRGALDARDTRLFAAALEVMGARVEDEGAGVQERTEGRRVGLLVPIEEHLLGRQGSQGRQETQ